MHQRLASLLKCVRISHILYDRNIHFTFRQLTSYNSKIYIRQGITLTGLGLPKFNTQLQVVSAIYSEFCSRIPMPCKPITETMFETYPAINTSTRVFTPQNQARGQRDIEFSSAEDPDGMLQRAKGDDFIHGEENYIEYKKTFITDEEKPRSASLSVDEK